MARLHCHCKEELVRVVSRDHRDGLGVRLVIAELRDLSTWGDAPRSGSSFRLNPASACQASMPHLDGEVGHAYSRDSDLELAVFHHSHD